MTTPDNARLLTDERAVLDAEGNLVREEQRLWQRFDAALSDPHGQRSEALAARLAKLEKLPDAPPQEVTRARALVKQQTAPPALAFRERATALQARRAAVEARQLALKAAATALSQVEAEHATRARQLDELDGVLIALEAGVRNAETARQAAQQAAAQDAARLAAADAEKQAAAARQAAEETARQAQAAKALAGANPLTTAPGIPAFDATTAPAVPALDVTQPSSPAIAAPAPTAAMPATSAPPPAAGSPDAPKRKVSRRRRVRLAPPPKKLDVEVATHGEDTFYTGWNGQISDGGLFVVSLETLPPGHELDLQIRVGDKTIKSRGKVQFNRRDNLANPDCQPGAGIKLLDLSRENAASIESFFAQRPPLFFVQP